MAVLLQWRPDWLTAAVLAVLVVLVVRARLRVRAAGQRWPVLRDLSLGAGVLLAVWTTSGWPQVRGAQVEWVWTAQVLLLLLVVPVLLAAGQPVALLRGTRPWPRAMRVAGHPALSPLYVPVAAGLLFFGGVGQLALADEPTGWAVHVALLGLGAVVALPLVDREDSRTSLAVGAALAVGVVELLLDAVPGIVLRLETHLTVPWFDGPGWLAGQQAAGGLLWTVAEVLDLPFLVLTVLQWIRVERREAVAVDAELDRAAPTADPWWLADPALRVRYGPLSPPAARGSSPGGPGPAH